MSLNELKDALQDYQKSYSECLGITPTPSIPTQGRVEANLALPQPDFKFEIPDPLEINSTQVTEEKVSSAQTEIDEYIPQQKRNQFVYYNDNDDKSQQANQSIQNRQRRPRTRRKKKEGFNFTPIIILFVFIMLCGIGYAIYDFYSPKKAVTSVPSHDKMSIKNENQQKTMH